ncbi:MAG TPA: PepSY domain-containing protein [Nitrospira sp.]|jgi:uncharacterized membrane protein YkoI|nr:PepSY domain-containing protein [Nitrospira sp.]
MKYTGDRLMQAKRTIALVSACSISIEQAISAAQSSVGGTVFDVRLKENEQQLVWRVKLVVGGQRVKVYVDARSGRVINAKAEILVTEHAARGHFSSRELEN